MNLERALTPMSRLGGHIVSGHIDGTGTISDMTREDNAVWVTVQTKPDLLKYMIEKGFYCHRRCESDHCLCG